MLHSIRNVGHGQARQIESEAQQRLNQINEKKQREADAQRQRILKDGEISLSRQQALIEQQALMRALQIHADARQSLVESALDEARAGFAQLRSRKDYKQIFTDLVQEALDAVQPSLMPGQRTILHIDPRDKRLAAEVCKKLKVTPEIVEDLECFGGCQAETEDQLVMVKNTIDSRFDHGLPLIRQEMAIFFEKRLSMD